MKGGFDSKVQELEDEEAILSTASDKPDIQWMLRHACAGNALAMHDLSNAYARGGILAVDGEKSLMWLKRAADAGNSCSCRLLSEIYERGELTLPDADCPEGTFKVERNPVLARRYKRKASVHERREMAPHGRVLFDPGAGWCTFSPDGRRTVRVSCCHTGDLPVKMLDAFVGRIRDGRPVCITMDEEGVVDGFAESGTPNLAYFTRDSLSLEGAKGYRVRYDPCAMARQLVVDIEADYYGWVTFNWCEDFARRERILGRKVALLKRCLARHYSLFALHSAREVNSE